MTLKQQAASGVKWSAFSAGIVTTLQFITFAILARLLSPSDFGLLGMIMVVIGFAQAFSDMGISNAIIHRQDATREQLSSLYWLNIISGIVVFFVLCASTPLVVGFYREPRLSYLLYLTALIFLITPFGQQFQSLLQKELKFDGLAKIDVTSAVVNSIVAIGLALDGFGVYALILGQLSAMTSKSVLLCCMGWPRWRPSLHFAKHDLKGYISFGLYQMGDRTINYLNSNLDYLLIGSMLGAKALGYYTLAYNLIIIPSSMINPVITKVAFPVFSKIQNETDKLRKGYLSVLQLLSTVNFPIMIGLAVVAPVAVPIIFGTQWLPSIFLVQILTIVGLLRSTGNPVGALLLAKGRADLGFTWNLSMTAVQIPALYLGANFFGTAGVAIAFAVVMAIYSILNYLILIRTLLGPCLWEYLNSMWQAFWMSATMGFLVFISGFFPDTGLFSNHLMILIIQVLLGISVYLVMLLHWQKSLIVEIMNLFKQKTFLARN